MNASPQAGQPSQSGQPMTRALFRSVAMDGQPSLYCKLYYPASYSGSLQEKNTGALPIMDRGRPYPVAVLMPGINVSPEAYGWLATALVEAGFISLIYGWIVEEMPGMAALSPGLDISALTPEHYGKRPSATALKAVLADLEKQNAAGPLAGQLDLQRVLLGGHSAGGSVALMNANADWFPGLRAAFAYGSHSKASTMLGYPADTVLPLPDALPLLILGGSEDGVIAASAFRYDGEGKADQEQKPDPVGPLQRSFDEALGSQRGDCYLGIAAGANHFSLAWPADPATGRPFLDWETQRPGEQIRADLARAICQFARAHVAGEAAARSALLETLEDREYYAHSAVR